MVVGVVSVDKFRSGDLFGGGVCGVVGGGGCGVVGRNGGGGDVVGRNGGVVKRWGDDGEV